MAKLNLISEVEDGTKDFLKEKAQKSGRSMTKEIVRILNICAKYKIGADNLMKLIEDYLSYSYSYNVTPEQEPELLPEQEFEPEPEQDERIYISDTMYITHDKDLGTIRYW